MKLLEIESEISRHKHGRQLPPKEGNLDKHARTAIGKTAKQIGLSHTTFERAKVIIEKADELFRMADFAIGCLFSLYCVFSDVKSRHA